MFSREIFTEILIRAGEEDVWALITDFASYPKWNPLMLKVQGKAVEGERLQILIHLFLATDMRAQPTVLCVQRNRRLSWKGGLAIPGLLDGEHILEVYPDSPGVLRLVQREIFTGLLAPLFLVWMGPEVKQGFENMNHQVKILAENLQSHES